MITAAAVSSIDRLVTSITGQPFSANDKIRMFESYEGVVKHADDEHVVVVYEVEEDLVEQTYVAKQFVDGKLPKVGDCLAVFVQVIQLPDDEEQTKGEITSNEQRRRPKNFVPLPRTF